MCQSKLDFLFSTRMKNYKIVFKDSKYNLNQLFLRKPHNCIFLGNTNFLTWLIMSHKNIPLFYDNNVIINPHIENRESLIPSSPLVRAKIISLNVCICEDYLYTSDGIVYVIDKKDLDKIVFSKEKLMSEYSIDLDSYKTIPDFLTDMEKKTGVSLQITQEELLKIYLSEQELMLKFLDAIFQAVVERKVRTFLHNIKNYGYKYGV